MVHNKNSLYICRDCQYKKQHKKDKQKWDIIIKTLLHLYKYSCALCYNNYHLQPHHIIPKGKGGCDNIINLIILCGKCHTIQH